MKQISMCARLGDSPRVQRKDGGGVKVEVSRCRHGHVDPCFVHVTAIGPIYVENTHSTPTLQWRINPAEKTTIHTSFCRSINRKIHKNLSFVQKAKDAPNFQA